MPHEQEATKPETEAKQREVSRAIRPQPSTEDPVFDDATALDTPVDMSAWQPALGERVIRHVLLQRQLLAAGVLVGIDNPILSTLKRVLAMVEDNSRSVTLAPSLALQDHDTSVIVSGAQLTIPDLVRVARQGAHVRLTTDEAVLHRVAASYEYVTHAVATGQLLYGVTTGFGAMATGLMAPEDVVELQQNLVWFLKAGAGRRLPTADVRAAMLLRANSHLRGASGIRLALIQRLVTFLNAHVTPHVREFGSIGASGDLVPLASITGALIGLDPTLHGGLQRGRRRCPHGVATARAAATPPAPERRAGDGEWHVHDDRDRRELCL